MYGGPTCVKSPSSLLCNSNFLFISWTLLKATMSDVEMDSSSAESDISDYMGTSTEVDEYGDESADEESATETVSSSSTSENISGNNSPEIVASPVPAGSPEIEVQVISEVGELEVSNVVEVVTETEEVQILEPNVEINVATLQAEGERSVVQNETSHQAEEKDCKRESRKRKSDECDFSSNIDNSTEDGQICTICFETWTNSGDHRLVSLKCGHLFGQSCIQKWVKGSSSRCPQCNATARKTDIRPIYAQKLKVLDTTELDRALKELEEEKTKNRTLQCDLASANQRLRFLQQDYEKLKREMMDLRDRKAMSVQKFGEFSSQNPLNLSQKPSFSLQKTVKLSANGCQRMTSSAYLGMLVVSHETSPTSMFQGFGIRKISTLDFKPSEFIFLHQGRIWDLEFHTHDVLVLTASQDKTVKITNTLSNSIVQSYQVSDPAYSCTWSRDDPNVFYAGLSSGKILQFDIRNTSEHLCELPSTGRKQPVIAMRHVARQPTADRCPAGVLSTQFQLCSFFEEKCNNEFKLHPFPLEGGNCISLSYEPNTRHVLLSCRPSARVPHVTHTVCEMVFPPTDEDAYCSYNIVQVFNGGNTQISWSRSCLCVPPDNVTTFWVCAAHETAHSTNVWDVSTGECVGSLSSSDNIVEVAPLQTTSGWLLSTLSKNSVSFYKWKNE